MALKLNGTNSVAAPAYAGADADTGLQCGTNELKLVTGGSARATVNSSGNLLVGTTSDSIYNDTSGGGFNIKNDGQLVLAKEATSSADPLVWLNDTGQTTNKSIVFAQDGSEKANIGLAGNDATVTVNGSEAMRLDSSGRLNINATSNSYAGARLQVNESVGSFFVTQNSHLLLQNKNSSTTNWWNIAPRDDGNLTIGNGAPGSTGIVTDRKVSIKNNGVVLIGKTSEGHSTSGVELKENGGGNGQIVATNNGLCLRVNRITSTGEVIQMMKSGTIVGRIQVSGSSTAYNTTSDYRVKENVVNLNGAIDRVKQLAPKRFNFIVEPNETVDGFLAHEAQTVVPEAVSGTHNEVDDDGNAVMQGIDQSKLVPLLTAALQEAIAKIETLETKVAALEAAS